MLLPAFCLRLLASARGDCAAHEPCDAAPGLPLVRGAASLRRSASYVPAHWAMWPSLLTTYWEATSLPLSAQ